MTPCIACRRRAPAPGRKTCEPCLAKSRARWARGRPRLSAGRVWSQDRARAATLERGLRERGVVL